MKTKALFQTTGLIFLMMLLTTSYLNAQLPFQGLADDHEGTAAWDADGTGPEAEAYGHEHPFGYGSSLYYGASRDFIDTHPDAALCHLLDDIQGFPLFEQALADNGYTAGQVKVKTGLSEMNDDIKGADWFTFNDKHYLNRYDANYFIELDGELMITGYFDYIFSYDSSGVESWYLQSNFTRPVDASENSSLEVQAVASAFLSDMNGQELRLIIDDMNIADGFIGLHTGRDGAYFNVVSGYLEKGLPKLPFIGLAVDHEGIAGWDADGSGPEPEAYGHTFQYGGFTWWMAYYTASRGYDNIDPEPSGATGHFVEGATGFPNLETQMAYRGYTMDQLKVKTAYGTLGNDIEGVDWGLDGSLHWYTFHSFNVTFEIAGEPILAYVIDTLSCYDDLDDNDGWWSISTYSEVSDISDNASDSASHVAASFLKDMGGQHLITYIEGHYVNEDFDENGRDGAFHEIPNAYLSTGYPDSLTTHVNEPIASVSEIKLTTYPNPFTNSTTIEYELNKPEIVTITIYNQIGKQVDVIEVRQQKGLNKVIWNPGILADGIYYFKFKAGEKRTSGKVVRAR